MKKLTSLTRIVIAVGFFSTLCSCSTTTEFDQKLDQNFIYQCAIKFYSDLDGRNVPSADVEKLCAAIQKDEEAKKAAAPVASPSPSASPEAALDATPTPVENPDEVKPEPTPANEETPASEPAPKPKKSKKKK